MKDPAAAPVDSFKFVEYEFESPPPPPPPPAACVGVLKRELARGFETCLSHTHVSGEMVVAVQVTER